MFYLAILGVTFNGFAVLRMRNSTGANQRVVMLHLLEDVLGWIAILIGSVIIKYTGLFIIDPILSLLVATYILYGAIKNFWIISGIFLQRTPLGSSEENLTNNLAHIKGISQVHDLHLWTLDGEYNIVTVHLVVRDETSASELIEIKAKARDIINQAGHKHYTIEIEFDCENCDFQDC
jgi:cobalt-zinc-cadmium efflux system protein